MERIFKIRQIRAEASDLLERHGRTRVFAFHGEMGAGKTTFIHAICENLQSREAATSPTFSLINEYSYPGGSIYHIDLYRLDSEEDAVRAGVEDSLHSGNLCFVEWPEKAPGLFPPDTVHIYLEAAGPDSRRIREETLEQ